MKEKEINLGINTAETFVAADGTVVSYKEIFEGILANVKFQSEHNGWKLSREDIEDIAQDAFLKAILYHGSFDPSKSRKPQDFGNRIAENCKIDTIKKTVRHAETFRPTVFVDSEGEERIPIRIAGYRGDEFAADSGLCREEMEELIIKAIGTLNQGYQDILCLHLQGYESREIAEQLGCKPSIVHTKLCRAKAALRAALGEDFEEEYYPG